jgi:hypothetical protein
MSDLPAVDYESSIVGVELPERWIAPAHMPYGMYQVAAEYCGLPAPPSDFLQQGEWQHGWNPTDWNPNPEAIAGTDGLSRHRRRTHTFLVARDDERDFLKHHGYAFVHSVGLPIVYEPVPRVERLPASLLVMPIHSLDYTKHDWDFEKYADEILAIQSHFSLVVACVSPMCFRRGYWIKAFERRNIPIISGADIFDARSFARMARLFSRFEFVTTNGRGSHIAYAAMFGAKPSIYGTIPPFKIQDYQNDAYYQNNPEILEADARLNSPSELRRHFPNLFVEPWSASEQVKWASFQVGVQCKKEPAELRRLLEWDGLTTTRRFFKRLPARVSRKLVHAGTDVLDPSANAKRVTLAELTAAAPGQYIRTVAPGNGLQSVDGKRLRWELQNFFYGDGLDVTVNPPDSPALDLAPREGVGVLSLLKHHADRRIFCLPVRGYTSEFLESNLHSGSRESGRVEVLHRRSEAELPESDSLFNPESWVSLTAEFREIFRSIGVVRMAVHSGNWRAALAALSDFPRCRLLLLECGEPDDYLGSLLEAASHVHFLPRFERLRYGRFQQAGFLARNQVVTVPLVRSGLFSQADRS